MKNANTPADPVEYQLTGTMHFGLTKREKFAMAAMQGLLASDIHANLHQNDCVHIAVTHADALLAELDKEPSQ